MIYKAIDVANYVLAYYADKTEDNLPIYTGVSVYKLQKILYFLQANHLCNLNKGLFYDDMKAVGFGILVQEVFDEYKGYGGGTIYLSKNKIKKYENKIYNEDKELMNGMLDLLKNYSNSSLTDIIQRQTPWKNAYYNWKNIYCKHDEKIIKNEDLIEFFSED